MGRGRTRIVRKAESVDAQASNGSVETEERAPQAIPGTVVVVLRDASHYVVAGQRFVRDTPKRVDSMLAPLFRSKGWFEVIG